MQNNLTKFTNLLSTIFLTCLGLLAFHSIFGQAIFGFDLASYSFGEFILNLIQNIQYSLVILAISVGALLFYSNRDKIESIDSPHEIPQSGSKAISQGSEQENELLEEEKRKSEFGSKFSVISRIPVFGWIVKWMYKEGWKYSLGLVGILILGFIIRYFFALNLNFDLDEGIHTYDAKLIFENKLPFVDYFAREPAYMYLLAIFLKITSANIFYTRLLSIIFFVFASIVLYFITKRFSKKSALLSLVIFNFSPFFIYSTYLGNLYTVYVFILLLICLFVIKYTEKKTYFNIIVLGLLLGIGVHFYRITIFFFPFVFFILLISKIRLKEKNVLLIFSAITFFLPILIFSYFAGYTNFEIQYGTNELLVGYIISVLFLYFEFIYKNIIKLFRNFYFVNLFYFFVIVVFFYVMLFGKLALSINSRIILQSLIVSSFFIFPGLILYLSYVKKRINNIFYMLLKLTFTIFIGYVYYYGSNHALSLQNYGVRLPSFSEHLFLLICILQCLIILFVEKLGLFNYDKKYNILLIFSISPLIFYIIHVQISITFFTFTSIFLIPIISHNIVKIVKNKYYYALAFMIIMFIFPILLYVNPVRDRLWSQDLLREVVMDINKIGLNEKYILTGAPIFAIESKKDMVLNNSRPTIYVKGDPNNLKTPSYINLTKNNVPLQDFISEIEKNIKIVILDMRLKSVLKSQQEFDKYFTDNFKLSKIYLENDLELWERK